MRFIDTTNILHDVILHTIMTKDQAKAEPQFLADVKLTAINTSVSLLLLGFRFKYA